MHCSNHYVNIIKFARFYALLPIGKRYLHFPLKISKEICFHSCEFQKEKRPFVDKNTFHVSLYSISIAFLLQVCVFFLKKCPNVMKQESETK